MLTTLSDLRRFIHELDPEQYELTPWEEDFLESCELRLEHLQNLTARQEETFLALKEKIQSR